ncbi:UDP-glycosyltransferase 72E1-like [Senna tora]|uniref:UDP-glycosyltransferase 72E1-like n=1 Tax=Senna tora TaxID=362788 RepID=A0A835CIU3_9FABA|nr:UDP-glycosyltransferase 72E1-like [Senna tora]
MPMSNIKPHVVLLASPGMGHLIPVIELAKRLHTHHGFLVTIVVVTTDTTTTRSHILHHTSNLPSLNVLILPTLDVSHKLGPNPSVVARLNLTMIESLPLLRSSILSMNPSPSALIVDLFGTPALPMARELGMLSYVFLIYGGKGGDRKGSEEDYGGGRRGEDKSESERAKGPFIKCYGA